VQLLVSSKAKKKRKDDRWVYEVVPLTADWKDPGRITQNNIVGGKRKSSMRS
jgi:hypothetical protein